MPINDPQSVQFFTGYDTFKNFDSKSAVTSIPNQSYTAGQFRQFTTVIPLQRTLAATQVLHNFSTSGFSDRWYLGNGILQVNFVPTSNFSTQIRCSYNGTNLTVDVYVINQTGGTVSSGTMDITTVVRRFVAPF